MGDDDLDRRRSRIREQELLLALEQWEPDYAGVITGATPAEREWLQQHAASQGPADRTARDADQWHELRRRQGQQANAAASAAFLAGDYARARDLIDDARAYGAIPENEWQRLHAFIAAQAASKAAEAA
jgi:hypothetical protein